MPLHVVPPSAIHSLTEAPTLIYLAFPSLPFPSPRSSLSPPIGDSFARLSIGSFPVCCCCLFCPFAPRSGRSVSVFVWCRFSGGSLVAGCVHACCFVRLLSAHPNPTASPFFLFVWRPVLFGPVVWSARYLSPPPRPPPVYVIHDLVHAWACDLFDLFVTWML